MIIVSKIIMEQSAYMERSRLLQSRRQLRRRRRRIGLAIPGIRRGLVELSRILS